jgi:D-serine deaminase-like pyridoxal phosphate-dependent protein
MTPYEYVIGLNKYDLDTPALLVYLGAMEHNLKQMSEFFKGKKAKLRPHVKLHKATPVLAHRQLEAEGTIGLTCAKLAEAETLAQAGIKDILIANQIVGHRKIRRLVNLAKFTQVMVAVDGYANIAELSEAAEVAGVKLRVLVEVNIGHNRCGVAPFDPALQMALAVRDLPGLRFMGLMGYDGHCTMKLEASQREACSQKANRLLVGTKEYIEKAGLRVEIVSASGTFTYKYAANIPGITEIQAGTYLLMDTAFQEAGVADFQCSLTVLGTVTSRPTYPGAEDLAVIDVGRKVMGMAYGMPEIKSPSGATILGLSQEHGQVRLTGMSLDLNVGDKLELWVRDANDTINRYESFHAIRDDLVEAVWDIPGRNWAT